MFNHTKASVDVVLDLQIGDTGKGRVVQWLCKNYKYNWVCRFNGADNAGHTVYLEDGTKIVLHLIPIGILQPECKVIIGHNVFVNPIRLKEEIDLLESIGIRVKNRLFISENCHIIFPHHQKSEIESGEADRIGSTKRGVTPCAVDKYGRNGIRIIDILSGYYHIDNSNIISIINDLNDKGYFADTISLLHREIELGSTILCEAAQGFALDIDMGIYPFVTSSNTTIGAVMTGLGISYAQIRRVIGVIKAYNTKVGTGPFITQTNEEIGNKIREVGNEYGATTGRPRKIGWLDLPQIRQAIRVNGVTEIIMTKLDVLYCIDKILVCDAYIDGAKILEYAPSSPKKYETMIPCYRHYDSWEKIECTEDSLNAIHFVNFYNFKDNPKKQNLRIFINDIINLLQIPIRFISVGTRNRDIISFFSNTELTQTILTGTSLCIDSEIPYTRDKTIYSSFIPRAQTWHTVDKTEAKNDKNKSESKAL